MRLKSNLFLLILNCVLLWPHVNVIAYDNTTLKHGRLVYSHRFAPHEGFVNRTEKKFRNEICLNGYWDFQPVALPANYRHGWSKTPDLPMPVDGAWSKVKIKIPSPWNINAFPVDRINDKDNVGPDHRNYPSYPASWNDVKMAWMRKTVMVPQSWDGQNVKLHFEAVAGNVCVYVNGEKVVENFDIFLPFDVDVSDKVKAGSKVEIMVGVRSYKLFDQHGTIGHRILPAGSMWGCNIDGIWQDVYMYSVPKIHVENVYVKPLVSRNLLEFEVELKNNTEKKANVMLEGDIMEWINLAGTDVNSAPVPAWELGKKTLSVHPVKVCVEANSLQKVTLKATVNGELKYWTPENPNLYSALLSVTMKKQTIDLKYERFGWREWTLVGTTYCLNGKPYALKGDSWHFNGIPQMTRRYAWAWFTAIKGMNGNAVRLHAQVYPSFYMDVADEMGICVLAETANWASDGGPKLDSELFWEHSKDHLSRMVLRDRNHASVFGWSISNENKPVILNVFNRPDLMPLQEKAWQEWRDIVHTLDPTRPWISSDGEEDGGGILPVTMGHYGGERNMKMWISLGKPWGVGEHSMAYYGTPEQVSKYNGERAYESQQGRMEGLAEECYNLIAAQRRLGASYSTVFNMAWYSLKPLPFGLKDLTKAPKLEKDGIFFENYVEGQPGVQPERVGPYCSTFNPGYDPSLPLYDPWPMYHAIRAANAGNQAAWSPYAVIDEEQYNAPAALKPEKLYNEVVLISSEDNELTHIMEKQGVIFCNNITKPSQALYIIDGSRNLTVTQEKQIMKDASSGADIWIWGLTPATVDSYNRILPLTVEVDKLVRSSFLPVQKSWLRGLNNSDFYYCELQKADAAKYTLKGRFVEEGITLLNACKTDWRMWNHCPEILKTGSVLRSERECTSATSVFVKYQSTNSCFYISTLEEFVNSERGYNALNTILKNAGIPCREIELDPDDMFFIRDHELMFPTSVKSKFVNNKLVFYIYSPRPLDDLLIEPNMPKLELVIRSIECKVSLNNRHLVPAHISSNESFYQELPLLKGWNKIIMEMNQKDVREFKASFRCGNKPDFTSLLNASYENPAK